MMESANKRQKRGSVSEEDVSILLQRYSATKVLALLREVAQSSSGAKIDWDALVKKTATGITNAREYQMVWRHIAYRHALAEKVDDGAEPMDDDSDLEFELEATPDVSADTMVEATACVKVLSASGLPSEANVQNCSTVEAPLATNIPNRQLTKSLSDNHAAPSVLQGTNITVPISVPKLSIPAAPSGKGGEVSGVNGSSNSNIPPRRKRKPWLEEEDSELIDAVKKFGEGNWTTILKEGFFKGDRTASQLAQRWAILKKKQNNLNIASNTSGTHLSEAQLAANRAIDMAFKDTTMTVGNGAAGANMNPPTINTSNGDNQPSNNPTSQSQKSQSQPVGGNPKLIAPSTTTKPRAPPINPVLKSMVIADTSMVTATAMAAGARVASPSDAASMLKAFQANNAIHIKSSMASTSNPFSCTPVSGHRNVSHPAMGPARHLPSPSTAPTSHAMGSQPVRANYVRPSVLSTAQHLPKVSVLPTLPHRSNGLFPAQPSKATTSAGMASGRSNNPASSSASGPPVGNRITSEESKTRPLLASSKTQNAEAKINPAPVLSSAELVVTSQVLAAEKPLFVAGVGKKKDGVEGNGCCDDGIRNVRNRMVLDNNITDNLPSAEGRVEEELSGKDEKVVKREPGILLSSKDGNSRSLEVAKELKAAVKLESK